MLKRLTYLALLAIIHVVVGITWSKLIWFSVVLLGALYVVFPLLFRYVPAVSRHMVFLSFVNLAPRDYLTNPNRAGLKRVRNFYLNTDQGVRLGVWHLLPLSETDDDNHHQQQRQQQQQQELTAAAAAVPVVADDGGDSADEAGVERHFLRQLDGSAPVVLYNHGNSGSRAGPCRIELYQVLQRLGCHVIAFDYRGYADSSGVVPTESGVVNDSRFVYKWLRSRVPASKILVWGHSMGTGVTCRLVAELCEEGDPPAGLILESPFNNIKDEVAAHTFSVLHRKMPFFEWFILEPLRRFDIAFDSDSHVTRITVPLAILHAEDDLVVPHRLGAKLYAVASRSMPDGLVQFHSFEASLQLGHKFICRSHRLPAIVRDFLASCAAVATAD